MAETQLQKWIEENAPDPGGGGDNTLAKAIVDRSVTAITAQDLEGITTIGQFAFGSCASLVGVEIPEGVTLIGGNGFYSCQHLESVIIPSTVTRINSSAFQNCLVLDEIHVKATTPPAMPNSNAFAGIAENAVFYVPYSEDHSILAAYQTATNWIIYAAQMQEDQ